MGGQYSKIGLTHLWWLIDDIESGLIEYKKKKSLQEMAALCLVLSDQDPPKKENIKEKGLWAKD